eukprot:3446976-Alexandrium_andersonii.AAC.1
MSASLVGSEMCIRDRKHCCPSVVHAVRDRWLQRSLVSNRSCGPLSSGERPRAKARQTVLSGAALGGATMRHASACGLFLLQSRSKPRPETRRRRSRRLLSSGATRPPLGRGTEATEALPTDAWRKPHASV